jgi:hypothetical protein
LFHQKHVLADHSLFLKRGVVDCGVEVAQSHRATLRHIIVEMAPTAPAESVEATGRIPIVGIDYEVAALTAEEDKQEIQIHTRDVRHRDEIESAGPVHIPLVERQHVGHFARDRETTFTQLHQG